MSADMDANVITPAQVAGLTAGIVVILICTGMSIYLCGRHKGCKEAAQRGILAISHSHHGHHQHTRLPDDARPSVSDANGKNAGGGRFAKLKEAFGVGVGRVASSTTTSTLEPTGEAPRMRATSPLQIHVNAGASSNSPHCGTDEFQAAVHNLLGYTQSDLREWYPDTDDDEHEEPQPEHNPVAPLSAIDRSTSPLPPYEEVEQPRRFSWQADESTYRPEKC